MMNRILALLFAVLLLGAAYRAWGWGGIALAVGALVMFLLMHFSRMMQTLRRAADRPLGSVASAVMLNAKLRPKVSLLHVIAMTRSLGERRSGEEEQPEVFRWTDAGLSYVDATFNNGKLVEWKLVRPEVVEETAEQPAPPIVQGVDPSPAAIAHPTDK